MNTCRHRSTPPCSLHRPAACPARGSRCRRSSRSGRGSSSSGGSSSNPLIGTTHERCSFICRAQQQQQQQKKPVQDAAAAAGSSEEAEAYSYSDPVNRFLGRFLPSAKAVQDQLTVDFDAPKLRGLSTEEMAQLVENGLARTQWFVTGEVDARLFSDDFAFKDESVATRGIRSYALGVRKLFDQQTSRAELITVTADPDTRRIVVAWRLEGGVNLPVLRGAIKPYVVTTTFELDSDGLICSQLDEFSVPGWDLLLSFVFGTGFGAPPAPPVEELRKAAAAEGRVPVGGSGAW